MQIHDTIDSIDHQVPKRRNIFQTKPKHAKNIDMDNQEEDGLPLDIDSTNNEFDMHNEWIPSHLA